jgi:hypothetical protein
MRPPLSRDYDAFVAWPAQMPREGARQSYLPSSQRKGLATFKLPTSHRGEHDLLLAKLPRVHRFILLLLLAGFMLCCLGLLLSLPLAAPHVSEVPGVSSALAGVNVGHLHRGANAPAPLAKASYPLTPAEEVHRTDKAPVNAYFLTMVVLALSFGASVLLMATNDSRRRRAASCLWGVQEDHPWLAVAHEGRSFLGVFRL